MKPTLSVHKFSSCDGCQLAFLNLGQTLLEIPKIVNIVHFAEAGPLAPDEPTDIAVVEGSISTPEDEERIQLIRKNSNYLISVGACATSGGLQALRNLADGPGWLAGLYAQPDYVAALATSTPISAHVRVDLELWGCPISKEQLLTALRSLLFGVKPRQTKQPLCMECKRKQAVCTLVTQNEPCMGPVTRAGCGAICPRFGRACYACYGPSERINDVSLSRRFAGFGLLPEAIAQRFHFINSNAPAYLDAGKRQGAKTEVGD